MQTVEVDIELPDICADALLDIREEPYRYLVLAGGRGSAKSHSIARALLALAGNEPLRILCGREYQRSIRDSVHRLLSDTISALDMGDHFDIMDSEIRGKNGSLFSFTGLAQHTVDSVKSFEGYDLCWLEEAQSLSQKTLDVLIPTIRKPRSRFILSMNPRLETDPVSKRFLLRPDESTKVIRMNWRDNPWFKDTELEAERIAHKQRDPDTYDWVWEGEHLPAVEGAVYFKEMQAMEREGRIRLCPIDPLLKTHTVWDLGLADNTAIGLVQVSGSGEVRIVGYIQDNNRALSDYINELNAMRLNWGHDWLPHDAFQRDFKDGKAPADMFRAMQRSVMRVPQATVENGIKKTREVFPRMWIDDRAEKLIDCLKRYRWDIPTNERDPKRPVHDDASHGADMIRYLSVAADQMNNDTWSPIRPNEISRMIV